MKFQGPYPEHIHIMDVFPDHLAPLLTDLLVACPSLLGNLSQLSAGARWSVIAAAIEAENPQFAEVILTGLKDRSAAVKYLVAGAISRHPFLRTH